MKAKSVRTKVVRIRQWLLFAVLVTIALYLHLRFPLESVVRIPDDDGADVIESLGDARASASSAPLATTPPASPRQGDRHARDSHAGTRVPASATAFESTERNAPAPASRSLRLNTRRQSHEWIEL